MPFLLPVSPLDSRRTPRAPALVWLVQQGVEGHTAAKALDVAAGNPGVALELARSDGLKLHAEVDADLRALFEGTAAASQIANRWSKSDPERRLWFAAMQLGDNARALTAPAELPKLAAGFDRINRAREQLRGPLRPELVILDALSALAA